MRPRPLPMLSAAAALALATRAARRVRSVELAGKVAFVTGGSRGLGFALAQELVREGAHVAICGRNERTLERARTRLQAMGADVVALRCDVSDRAQAERAVADITARFGRIDLLVNVAGVISVGPLSAMRHEDFEEAMAIMYWGVVHPTLAVLPQMRARGDGHIANITSIAGKISVPRLISYNPAKFAAVGFSEGLHAAVAKDGINVLTVVPGLMRTGSYLNAYFKGNARLEYSLFAPLAALPLTTIGARRAARLIVRAIKERRAELTYTLHARALARLNGLAPALTARTLTLVDRVLPEPGGPTARLRGQEIDSPVARSPLMVLGKRAASAFNQLDAAS